MKTNEKTTSPKTAAAAATLPPKRIRVANVVYERLPSKIRVDGKVYQLDIERTKAYIKQQAKEAALREAAAKKPKPAKKVIKPAAGAKKPAAKPAKKGK